MRYKKHKRIVCKILVVMLAIIVLLLVLYFAIINPIIMQTAKLNLERIGRQAINQSFMTLQEHRLVYTDLINISYDDNNRVNLIQVNSYQANVISQELVDNTESILYEMGRAGVDINSGIFGLLPIFSGSGKNFNLVFNQIGAVGCDFSSEFESAGVNQNIHRLYATINVSLGIVFPFYNESVNVTQKVVLCENIIIGEIPNTYLQSTELDSLLNLVPS